MQERRRTQMPSRTCFSAFMLVLMKLDRYIDPIDIHYCHLSYLVTFMRDTIERVYTILHGEMKRAFSSPRAKMMALLSHALGMRLHFSLPGHCLLKVTGLLRP